MYQQKRREKRYQSTGKLPGTLLTRDGRIRLENCTVCEISSRGIGMFLRQEKAVLLEKLQANGLDVDIPKRKIA